MKILVTGGCGFIGSNFIHFLLRETSHKVVNLDLLTYAGNIDNLRDITHQRRYKFIKGDICDPECVFDVVRYCDVVVNFAAETHVDRSIISAGSFIRTNVTGVYVLLEAVRKYRTKRFVQISTDEVYGSILKGSFSEQDPLKPNSPYAASKASADLLCRAYFVTYKTPIIITRSSNNFGPYQYPEKVIPLFITNALKNKKLPLYADGMNIRDWIYVEDNCLAIYKILLKGKAGEIYNIGGGNEITNLKLTKLILDILEKPHSLIKFVKDRPGHDKRYSLDSSKMFKIGWRPKHPFKSALYKTIEWYKENRWWWEKLITN